MHRRSAIESFSVEIVFTYFLLNNFLFWDQSFVDVLQMLSDHLQFADWQKMCAQSTQRLQLSSAMPIVDNELIASSEGPELLLPFESVGTVFDKVLRRNLSQHGDAVWLVSCLH